MSLCAWFPLIGTLDNQGTDNVSFTTTGTSWATDGKIGKCLKLGYTSNFTIPSLVNAKQISIAYWLKVNTATSSQWKDTIHFQATNGTNTYTCRHELYSNCTYSGWFADCGGSKSGMSCTVNKWTHYVITMDFSTGVSKVYVDGILFGQGDAINTNYYVTGSNFCLGENGLDLSENDVRIYNHILSPKEVEILSRGLVVHYPLSLPMPNLAKGSNTDSTSTNSFGFSEATGGSTRTIEYDGGIPCAKITRNSTAHSSWSYLWYSNWDRAAIKPSTTYTLSFDIIGSGSGSIGFSGFMQGNGTNSISASVEGVQNTFNSDGWSHLVFRTTTIADFTDKGTNQVIYMGCSYLHNTNVWIMMKNMKLEEGVNDTPWIPHTSDTGYSTMGLNDTTEYDVSGYKYNGTKIGSPTYSSDTQRYSTSTSFNGVDDCIQVPLNTFFPNAGSFTVNLWFKKHEIGSKNYETVFGGISGFEMDTRNNTSTTLSYYVTGNNRGLTVQSPLNFDTWYMLTMVCDGTNELYYLNGEYEKQIEKKGMPTGNYFIGAWNSATRQNFKGLISDFRVYATALSATQVAELYNTAASITDSGTLMAYEFVEQ